MAYRRNRNLNGPEKCQARSIITSFNGQAPNVVYLFLSSLTVLRSCFPSLQAIGEVIYEVTFSKDYQKKIFWQIRTILFRFLLFAGLAVLFFARPRRTLSLRLFPCEIAMAAFLFHVTETTTSSKF